MTINNVLNDKLRVGTAFRIPPYQRGSVWSQEQSIRFIESVLLKLPIGIYAVDYNVNQDIEGLPPFDLLDGQQRWRAIFDYTEDKFPVFGLLYSELSSIERFEFRFTQFPRYETKGLSEEEKEAIFKMLAYGGVPNSPDDAPSDVEYL